MEGSAKDSGSEPEQYILAPAISNREEVAPVEIKGLDKELLARTREKIRLEGATPVDLYIFAHSCIKCRSELPEVAIGEIRPATEDGRRLLRALKELHVQMYSYRDVEYHFHYAGQTQFFTTTNVDRPRRGGNAAGKSVYYQIPEDDIALIAKQQIKFRQKPKPEEPKKPSAVAIEEPSSGDDMVFDDAKVEPKEPAAPTKTANLPTEKKKPSADLEAELLGIFAGKRPEPEPLSTSKAKGEEEKKADMSIIPPKKPTIVGDNEYMECYPTVEEYGELEEDPEEFGEKVKEMFNSAEQIGEDEKWASERRTHFQFGGTAAEERRHGGKKKHKGRSDASKIERVST